jgi:hypothetical protein
MANLFSDKVLSFSDCLNFSSPSSSFSRDCSSNTNSDFNLEFLNEDNLAEFSGCLPVSYSSGKMKQNEVATL